MVFYGVLWYQTCLPHGTFYRRLALMMSGSHTLAPMGPLVFFLAVWGALWLYLYDRAGIARHVPPPKQKRVLHFPPTKSNYIKLASKTYECYVYCSMSYLPAFPWQSIPIPSSFPPPQLLFTLGVFEFEDILDQDVQLIGYRLAASFLLHVYRNQRP